jgi:hypothetical protein
LGSIGQTTNIFITHLLYGSVENTIQGLCWKKDQIKNENIREKFRVSSFMKGNWFLFFRHFGGEQLWKFEIYFVYEDVFLDGKRSAPIRQLLGTRICFGTGISSFFIAWYVLFCFVLFCLYTEFCDLDKKPEWKKNWIHLY